ncbi:MAG: alpha/beta fold hydrolase [Actinobacteria bacterium]|nr:alpha/beta fold hydrolase [Actinomycetota bacterium]
MSTMTYPVMDGAEAWSSPGKGDTAQTGVVVVHGLTGNPHSTRPIGELLADDGYAIEVVRLPGHGTHWKDMAATRYLDWRGEAERVTDELKGRCDRVVLVGLSMGGTIALDIASRKPEGIAGVVAINAQLLDPDQFLAKLSPILQHVVPAVKRDLAGLPSDDIAKPGGDERAYAMVPSKAARSLVVELPRIRAQLMDLEMPILVAYSPQDHTVPAKNSLAIKRLASRADVTELELARSYHVATLDWDRDLLEQAILDFVKRVS